MGEVYRATDTTLGRQVALKILPEAVAADEERLARFDREARILATLSHPNIAVIYGVDRSTSTPALVMELVGGPTLADRIAQGPIPADEAIEAALQVAAALEAAHHAGVIHRDLKPANIKLRDDGVVKVLDFGLAKTVDPPGAASASASISPTITSPALTVAGVILGTAAYMAPEQARGRRADHRADIWAFGCVLFEMLTGQRPFGSAGDDVSDTIAAVLKSEPDWRALPSDTPPAVTRLLRRCLAKDPRERLHDIADARLELRDAQEPIERPSIRPAWNRRVLVVAAALIAAAVLTGAPYLRNTPPPIGPGAVYRAVILPPTPAASGAATTPRTLAPRFGRGVAISPDGQRLAFVAPDADGRAMLWIRRLDGLSAQLLAGTEGALSPFWSPDGRRIGFVAGRSLKRIDAAGGPAVSLAEGVEPFSPGSWNRDDVILFTRRDGIFRTSGAGGVEQRVTTSDGLIRHAVPFFLPDGRRFLFSGSILSGVAGGTIYAASLDSPEPKKIRDGGSLPAYASGHLLFVEDNALMVQPFDPDRLETTGESTRLGDEISIGGAPGTSGLFAVSPSGMIAYQSGNNNRATFVWMDQTGKQQGPSSETRAFGYPQLSPDGRHLAISVRENLDRNRDLWVYDTVRGSRTRVTDDPSDDFSPVWSPDGRQIVYSATRPAEGDTNLNLYIRNWGTDGSDRRLLDREGVEIPSSWSPDGRFILFQTQTPNADIFVLSVGDLKVTPFATSRFGETNAKFSPDGRLVAYVSDETGRPEVYLAPFGNAAADVAVSTGGAGAPRWRHDGKELFYIRSDDTLMAVSIRASATGIDVGMARALFQTAFQGLGLTTPYDVTADGRFLVLRDVDEPLPPAITLLINWPAALKKQ